MASIAQPDRRDPLRLHGLDAGLGRRQHGGDAKAALSIHAQR
jgi:hypothetical protein